MWLVVALLVAVVLGKSIRLADRHASNPAALDPSCTLGLPGTSAAASTVRAVRVRRRAVPLPPFGVALAAVAVALETVGYVRGLDGSTTGLLSMDAPLSLPRTYVALLFAAAALAAVAGAGSVPGRRTWWLAVAVVGGGVAAVKAGGTVHAEAMAVLTDALGSRAATLISGLVAVVVVAVLWFLSRTERRDRRRVLGTLAGYAVASVGLSAVSAAVPASLYVTATFVEESGEALAGVAFLMAVLVGVAPRLVLPASWALRRTADAQPLEAFPGTPAAPNIVSR